MFKTLKLEDDILNHEIFKLAFVHKSSSIQHNNERLEYLGDAVLQLTISANVSNIFHSATEGELTRIRAIEIRDFIIYFYNLIIIKAIIKSKKHKLYFIVYFRLMLGLIHDIFFKLIL